MSINLPNLDDSHAISTRLSATWSSRLSNSKCGQVLEWWPPYIFSMCVLPTDKPARSSNRVLFHNLAGPDSVGERLEYHAWQDSVLGVVWFQTRVPLWGKASESGACQPHKPQRMVFSPLLLARSGGSVFPEFTYRPGSIESETCSKRAMAILRKPPVPIILAHRHGAQGSEMGSPEQGKFLAIF